MKINVTRDNVVIDKNSIKPHENEYNITQCHFTFDDFIDSFQVKRVIFTVESTGEMYENDILDYECEIPSEVLEHEYETIRVGVYGYNIGENEELLNRFSPSYDEFIVPTGSYKEGALSPEPITPSQYDIYSSKLQEGLDKVDEALEEVSNVNISAKQLDDGASVTITDRNGEDKTITIHDGEKGDTGEQGPQGVPGRDATINGVNTLNIIEGTNISLEQTGSNLKISNTYTYNDTEVKTDINNLKTNKADKSEIPTKTSQLTNDSGFITNATNDLINYYLKSETYSKNEVNDLISAITTLDIQVVETLPTQDISTTTIYLVPKSSAGTNDAYDEYIYVPNNWEFIGSTQVDLTDYVKNTDYATANKGGVIKTGHQFTLDENNKAQCNTYNYSNYNNAENNTFVSKGTLENVIAGKDLTTKAYVDGLVGDIGTILDNINGEVIGG